MDYEATIKRLKEVRAKDIPEVAAGARLGTATLMRLKYGYRKGNCHIDTVQKLATYFERTPTVTEPSP